MPAICQIMIMDFMRGYGRHDDRGYPMYAIGDLENGIEYASNLIEHEKLKREPLHGYDLKKFIAWARKKIQEIRDDNELMKNITGKDKGGQ